MENPGTMTIPGVQTHLFRLQYYSTPTASALIIK